MFNKTWIKKPASVLFFQGFWEKPNYSESAFFTVKCLVLLICYFTYAFVLFYKFVQDQSYYFFKIFWFRENISKKTLSWMCDLWSVMGMWNVLHVIEGILIHTNNLFYSKVSNIHNTNGNVLIWNVWCMMCDLLVIFIFCCKIMNLWVQKRP